MVCTGKVPVRTTVVDIAIETIDQSPDKDLSGDKVDPKWRFNLGTRPLTNGYSSLKFR
jgi:hypothetical protein